jgi:large subunit ribosomal protein L25
MLQVEMSAAVRATSGKGPMRQLRMQGMTPAVVYGSGIDAVNIQLETKKLMAQLLEYYRKNVLVNLKIDGMGDKNVTIVEVQTDPVHDTLIHVDFCEIDLAKERSFNVPVTYTGVAKGVDLGGFLAISHNSVVLEAKPLDIPDECVVDITDLDIGDNIKCSEIIIPDNVKLMTDPESVAVVVVKPGAQEVEEEVEEEGVEGEEAAVEETEAEE